MKPFNLEACIRGEKQGGLTVGVGRIIVYEPPKVKKSGWVNVYKYDKIVTAGTGIYNTKEGALKNKLDCHIDTVEIHWEE